MASFIASAGYRDDAVRSAIYDVTRCCSMPATRQESPRPDAPACPPPSLASSPSSNTHLQDNGTAFGHRTTPVPDLLITGASPSPPPLPALSTISTASDCSSPTLLTLVPQLAEPFLIPLPASDNEYTPSSLEQPSFKGTEHIIKDIRPHCASRLDESISWFSSFSSTTSQQSALYQPHQPRRNKEARPTHISTPTPEQQTQSEKPNQTHHQLHPTVNHHAPNPASPSHLNISTTLPTTLMTPNYLPPWELRPPAPLYTDHIPASQHHLTPTTPRPFGSNVATHRAIRSKRRVRVHSEPNVIVPSRAAKSSATPKPDERVSCIAEGMRRGVCANSGTRNGRVVGGMAEKKKEDSTVVVMAAEQCEPRPTEMQYRSETRWMERYFWEGETEFFEPAMRELRRSSGAGVLVNGRDGPVLVPGGKTGKRKAKRVRVLDAAMEDDGDAAAAFEEQDMDSPVWGALKALGARWAGGVREVSARCRCWVRKVLHSAKHYVRDQRCTDDCFADAFERASLLHWSSMDPSRSNSYDTLSTSVSGTEELSEGWNAGYGCCGCGCVSVLKERIRNWVNGILDCLDGTRRRSHMHQAAIDPEACHRLVTHLRKQRHSQPSRRRSSAAYRWVQKPKHGWVYERYT